ncbi:lamin tail domain-containing protein [Streptomyces sp. NBC_01294]|uniref:lamin tail domain-containing protein n=1 Tax=Streptomyces sp. NBC_01294 TaxID=2903815 RepID=UPI002DD7D1CE|nr:lamin tail domain-containing protein [Streptomyces sp. NBC_01294]WRZ61556.1 lamin tail domain-containing protein [Streptomyces sp. NBC_01294]
MSASLATRRAFAALLAAGTLIGAAALPAAADDHRRDHRSPHSSIVIGGVQSDGPGRSNDRSNRALNGEWVEVKNTGRHSVNLRGFTLTDRDGNRATAATTSAWTAVPASGSTTGEGRGSRHDVYQDRRQQVWDERDSATLRDNRGKVIDTESWNRRGHQHRG